jgi:hypothetical protein
MYKDLSTNKLVISDGIKYYYSNQIYQSSNTNSVPDSGYGQTPGIPQLYMDNSNSRYLKYSTDGSYTGDM